jgi:hypothetical protein
MSIVAASTRSVMPGASAIVFSSRDEQHRRDAESCGHPHSQRAPTDACEGN